MRFLTCIIVLGLASKIWTLRSCPKCVATIEFDQPIQVPTDCGQTSGDYCELDIAVDLNTSSIRMVYDSKMAVSPSDPILSQDISYMNYFDFESIHFNIKIIILCSTNDTCAFDIGREQLRKIIIEMSPVSEWLDLRSKLLDILMAPVDSVPITQCYQPNDIKESCAIGSSACYVEHIIPTEIAHEQSHKKAELRDIIRWRAGCSQDSTIRYMLTTGYSMTEPPSRLSTDYIIYASNCNKTLCNGGNTRKNVIQLLAKYPTIGGWFKLPSRGSSVWLLSYYRWLILLLAGLSLYHPYL